MYGSARLNRPVYNTNDFADATEDEKPQASGLPQVDGGRDKKERDGSEAGKIKKEKKEKKHKKNRDSNGHRDRSSKETAAAKSLQEAGASATAAHGVSPNIKAKRSKEKKSAKTNDGVPQTSAKKRKRESEGKPVNTATVNSDVSRVGNGSFVLGPDMLKGIEASMEGIRDLFNTHEPEKKKSKKTAKSTTKPGKAQATIVSQQETAQKTQTSKDEKSRCKSSGATPRIFKTPKSEKQKKEKDIVAPKTSHSSVRVSSSPVKHTPVPLPPPSSVSTFSANRAANQNKAKEATNAQTPEVMVPETPASKIATNSSHAFNSAIPFPSSRLAEAAKATPRTARKERLTHVLSSSAPSVDHDAQVSAPPSTKKADEILRQCGILSQKSPTKSRKLTAPLNDEPKPRPRGRASSQSSSSSRSSSISIPDLFNRINNPSSRSGVNTNPFITPEAQKKKARETHDESAIQIFNERFLAAQDSVNFSNEQEYLNQYLYWQVNNASEYPIPCLGGGSGCTANKEKILRLSKEENVNILKALAITGGDNDALKDATEDSKKAEEFLKMAIRARVPVPIGRLDGTWSLYCPKYAEHHFDRYGFGQRTFTMYSIAGFKDKAQYTGRLHVPPRPYDVPYTVLTFAVPPHASFRSTIITTAPEGYKMEVIFLGNGFLQLRLDLNLLLRGKPTEMVGGKKVFMEFVGVHEDAVEWAEKKDDLEE
jgi:hypothetical protein